MLEAEKQYGGSPIGIVFLLQKLKAFKQMYLGNALVQWEALKNGLSNTDKNTIQAICNHYNIGNPLN